MTDGGDFDPTEAGSSAIGGWIPLLTAGWLIPYGLLFYCVEMPNSHWHRLDLALLLPDLFFDLVFPPKQPGVHSGWEFLGQRIPILLPAGFILMTAWSAGRLGLRGLTLLESVPRPTRMALCPGLGLSFVSLFTLLCGVLGVLNRTLFLGTFLIVVIADGTLTWARQRRRFEGQPHRRCPTTPRMVAWSTIAAALPFLACMLLGAMLPSTDFDVKEYHLQGPKEFFLDGAVHWLPHNVYTSFPFLTEMLSLCGMVLRDDWYTGAQVGKTVLMAFAPIAAIGVFDVARRIAGPVPGAWAAVIYLSTPWTYRISIIAYTEGALCCYVVLTLLALFVFQDVINRRCNSRNSASDAGSQSPLSDRHAQRWAFVTGLLAGSAVATKYPGILLVTVPAGVLVLLASARGGSADSSRSSRVVRHVLAYSLGVLLTFGPWMAKNTIETGNPVYPLLYSVFGGEDWDAELDLKWKDAHARPADTAHGVADMLFENDWHSPLLWGFAPWALLTSASRGRVWLVAALVLWILAIWYLLTHRIDRFWVPVIPLLAVLAGIGLHRILGLSFSPPNSIRFPVLSAGTGVISLALTGFALVYNFGFITSPLCGNNAYLMSLESARETTRTPSIALIEQMRLPDTARVLFVGEAQVFDATFEHVYNTVFDHNLFEKFSSKRIAQSEWMLLSNEEIRQNLRRAGITHLFVNWNEILRYRTTYGYTEFVTPERFRQLQERGIITELSLPPQLTLRAWEELDDSWKSEIEGRMPELKTEYQAENERVAAMRKFQMFEAVLEENGP